MAQPHAIFINYRRSDTQDVAGRIYDRLKGEFGAALVFKDVDNIPFGKDFGERIAEVLRDCRIFLLLIGPRWLAERDAAGATRLDNAEDWVRVEIETALSLGLTIVPVLVNGASMPRPAELPGSLQAIRRLNAARLRGDPDFHQDADRLLRSVRAGGVKGAKPGQWARRGLLTAAVAGVGAGAFALWPRPRIEDDLPIPDGFYLVSESSVDEDAIELPMRGSAPVRVATTPLIQGGVRRAVVADDGFGQIVVNIELTDRGAAQMHTATASNIGRRLAVVVYGAVVFDAVIREPISAPFVTISGGYTEPQARAIATRLSRRT